MKEECRRKVAICVISDAHLGTYGSKAEELYNYLCSIKPDTLILNGDIIDIWQFNKRYWPKSHMRVVKQLMNFIAEGVRVIYIPGNHDEHLRKFAGLKLDLFEVVNQIVLPIGENKRAWIFHGDVFDITMQHSKWIARLGASGYALLILLNRFCNTICKAVGKGPYAFSKRIKQGVKRAGKAKKYFVETAMEIAQANRYDYVICGHLHQAEIRSQEMEGMCVTYLNSGDWVESLTALEFNDNEWQIYTYQDLPAITTTSGITYEPIPTNQQLFESLLKEFASLKV